MKLFLSWGAHKPVRTSWLGYGANRQRWFLRLGSFVVSVKRDQ